MVKGASVPDDGGNMPSARTRTTWRDATVLEFLISRFNWLPFQQLLQLLLIYSIVREGCWSFMLIVGCLLCAHFAQLPAKPGVHLPRSSRFEVLVGTPRVVNCKELCSNCNTTVASFDGRFYCAVRRAEVHFPSPTARLTIYATPAGTSVGAAASTAEWRPVWEFHSGNDLREPLFFVFDGKLFFYFFEGKPQPTGFSCFRTLVTTFDGKQWAEPHESPEGIRKGEIVWEVKVHGGRAFKTSYIGEHYNVAQTCIGMAEEKTERLKGMQVLFDVSDDGLVWKSVGESSVVYTGGVSEVAFEWDDEENLVAIGRNEDGDVSGFGTQMFFARKGDWGRWKALPRSESVRYDSPRMFKCGSEVLMAARYTPYAYDLAPSWLPFKARLVWNLLTHSHRPKSCAVYRIAVNPAKQQIGVELLRTLPESRGDTAFPSVLPCTDDPTCPAGASSFLVANYTSRDVHSHAHWLFGQLNETDVWVVRMLMFPSDKVPCNP